LFERTWEPWFYVKTGYFILSISVVMHKNRVFEEFHNHSYQLLYPEYIEFWVNFYH
jgi:hypothetical protein